MAAFLGHGTGCRDRGIFDAILFFINYQVQTYYSYHLLLFCLRVQYKKRHVVKSTIYVKSLIGHGHVI